MKTFKAIRHFIYQICVLLAALSFFGGLGLAALYLIAGIFSQNSALGDICYIGAAICGLIFVVFGGAIVFPPEIWKSNYGSSSYVYRRIFGRRD